MMLRSILSAALAAILLCHPLAAAAEEKAKGKDGKDDPALTQQVDLMPVAIPINYHDILVNYVFVRIRVHLFKPTDAPVIHTKEPYIRDRLVRTANHTSFNAPDDLNRVDARAMEKMLFTVIEGMVGRGVVKRVEIFEQTPQKGLPRPNP
jgi:hypothetical protein